MREFHQEVSASGYCGKYGPILLSLLMKASVLG